MTAMQQAIAAALRGQQEPLVARLRLPAITALAARVERFELGEVSWRRNNALHGLARLDVRVHT